MAKTKCLTPHTPSQRLTMTNSPETIEKLVTENTGIVGEVFKRIHCQKRYINDVLAAGNLGLLKAAQDFDPEKAQFSTYAWTCVYRAMCRETQKLGKTSHKVFSQMENADGETIVHNDIHSVKPDNNAAQAELIEIMKANIAKLSEQEQIVIAMILNEVSLQGIGDALGFSRQRADQIHKKALGKLQTMMAA